MLLEHCRSPVAIPVRGRSSAVVVLRDISIIFVISFAQGLILLFRFKKTLNELKTRRLWEDDCCALESMS